jgi:hypothetical protein
MSTHFPSLQVKRPSVHLKKEDENFENSPALEAANLIYESLVKNRYCLCWRFPKVVFSIYVGCSPHRRKQIEDAYYQLHGVVNKPA